MLNLTFGEQVKIVLNRKGMTIKELAEQIETQTGKKMSRQNLTQRLGRDNFQEQDMRLIADILGCPFRLNILAGEDTKEQSADVDILTERELEIARKKKKKSKTIFLTPSENQAEATEELPEGERDMTIGELVEIHEELDKLEEKVQAQDTVSEDTAPKEIHTEPEKENTTNVGVTRPFHVIREYIKNPAQANEKTQEAIQTEGTFKEEQKPAEQQKVERAVRKVKVIHNEEERQIGEINPYTGKEYETNSVRVHPNRIGYVQVYSQEDGKWTDMTEWAFLGYQERMKSILGKTYVPPIYLD